MFYSVLWLTICRLQPIINIDYGFLKRGVYLDGQNPVLHSSGRYVPYEILKFNDSVRRYANQQFIGYSKLQCERY
jgi:hypothetical protein